MERSRKVGQPYDHAQALCFASEVYLLQRDRRAAVATADEAAAVARENGFNSFLAISGIYERALRDGSPEDMQRLIDDRKGSGERWNESRFLAILAERHLCEGAFDAALRCLDDAFRRVQAGERYHEAELCRLKGEVLLARAGSGAPSQGIVEAEASFRRGIAIAQDQHAKLFELRGAVSLGRLLAHRVRGARRVKSRRYPRLVP